VLRYTAGKADWLAAGLPSEGAAASRRRAGHAARRDVATCRPDERLHEIRARTADSPGGVVVVVNEAHVVLGLLDAEALESADAASAEDVMDPAPTTYRPSLPLEQAMEWMRESKKGYALVTTGDAVLVGLLERPAS
jgi:CBS domain-containing protein